MQQITLTEQKLHNRPSVEATTVLARRGRPFALRALTMTRRELCHTRRTCKLKVKPDHRGDAALKEIHGSATSHKSSVSAAIPWPLAQVDGGPEESRRTVHLSAPGDARHGARGGGADLSGRAPACGRRWAARLLEWRKERGGSQSSHVSGRAPEWTRACTSRSHLRQKPCPARRSR